MKNYIGFKDMDEAFVYEDICTGLIEGDTLNKEECDKKVKENRLSSLLKFFKHTYVDRIDRLIYTYMNNKETIENMIARYNDYASGFDFSNEGPYDLESIRKLIVTLKSANEDILKRVHTEYAKNEFTENEIETFDLATGINEASDEYYDSEYGMTL